MNPHERTTLNRYLRNIAAILSFAFVLNQFAYAASLPDTPTPAQTPNQTASTPQPQPHAPVPSQIAAAHTIFLDNAGADANFPLTGEQSYDAIYAALHAWNYYQLVSTPAQADLILQLRGIAPITNIVGDRGGTYSITSPAFQLVIKDRKSGTALWTITSPVSIVGKKDVRDRWTSIAVTNLVSRVKVLANQPLTATESADLTTVPKNHYKRNAILLVSGAVGLAAVGAIVIHHEYENSLANQKQQQINFCIANGIPLNECAGA
jgi:hypothetical protein